MKKTVDEIMVDAPRLGYTREEVEALVGDGVTAEEFVELDVHSLDSIWALILVWMSPKQCVEFAQACADRTKEWPKREWPKREWTERIMTWAFEAEIALKVETTLEADAEAEENSAALKEVVKLATRNVAMSARMTSPTPTEGKWQIKKALEIIKKGEENAKKD